MKHVIVRIKKVNSKLLQKINMVKCKGAMFSCELLEKKGKNSRIVVD